MSKTSISLVLGSGGARGMAHIGVIQYLEEHGFAIKSIAGTSIGALVGGVYATGKLGQYRDWVSELNRSDIVKLLDLSFSRHSLFKGERVIEALRELIGHHDIEDLGLDYTAVATDLKTRREVWLTEGPLFDAIRASIAVPTVFAPVKRDGALLVDGGLINPIPIAPIFAGPPYPVVAVDLNGQQTTEQSEPAKGKDQDDAETESSYRLAIRNFLEGLMNNRDTKDAQPDFLDLVTQSIDIMQSSIARLKLAAYSPDVIVQIPRNAASFFEFDRSKELVELGYSATREALEARPLSRN